MENLNATEVTSKTQRIDLTGQTFGVIKVLGPVPAKPPGYNQYWRCRCICQREWSVLRSDLIQGKVVTCGCRGITQYRFGYSIVLRLTVKSVDDIGRIAHIRCICGRETYVRFYNLTRKEASSCGCMGRGFKTGRSRRAAQAVLKRKSKNSEWRIMGKLPADTPMIRSRVVGNYMKNKLRSSQ